MLRTIEEVESFWSAHPCNSRRSQAQPGTLTYFYDIARNKSIVEPHIQSFVDFPKWEYKNVLELGCGIGTDAVRFASHKAWYTGVDISPNSLALAHLNAQVNQVEDRCKFICGDMEEFVAPTPLGGWDLLYAFGSIHHTPCPKAALNMLRFYASPWTELKIMLYHARSWKMWEGLLRGDRRTEAVEGCPIAYTYTRNQAIKLVEGAGFEVTGLEVRHIFPYKIPEYKQGKYVRRPVFRVMGPRVFNWLERHYGFHLCITARPI